MTVQLLIDAIVRQTTVLIAQLATAGGVRAPLANVANQVFVDLSRELEAHGVSRKVSADMFGMALRTYLRKIQRLNESSTDRGRSLWEAVFGFIREQEVVTRAEVERRFHRDDEVQLRGVLRDLTDSGLVFSSGTGHRTAYRATSEDDVDRLRRGDSPDEMIWALVFCDGPIGRDALAKLCSMSPVDMDGALDRLTATGRVARDGTGDQAVFTAMELFVPLDATVGWEAAVYDHFHALVQTLCRKTNQDPGASSADVVGASTYTFDLWDGHPFEERVMSSLRSFRAEYSELRAEVEEHNATAARAYSKRVVVYAGQYVAEEHHETLD